ncbi:MAG: glycosyltransferase family A protein [Planctomycetota bacterium]
MRPRHSIIVTHRDRHAHLAWLVWSIWWCAEQTRRRDFEVVVVHAGEPVPSLPGFCRIVRHEQPMPVFHKTLLQSIGIDHAVGDVLTFLDADAIVGPQWLGAVDALLSDPSLTKLCYRVYGFRAPANQFANPWDRPHDANVADYDWIWRYYRRFDHAFEGRRLPHTSPPTGEPLFGNSHFSILRSNLGTTRPPLEFIGAAYEDIAFNRAIWHAHGDRYRARLAADPPQAVARILHKRYQGDWRTPKIIEANRALYHAAEPLPA